jgi:hypothetical protein
MSKALPACAENAEPQLFCGCYRSIAMDDADAFCCHTASLMLRYESVSSARRYLIFVGNSYFRSFPGRKSATYTNLFKEPYGKKARNYGE